jgi:DNA processing protein
MSGLAAKPDPAGDSPGSGGSARLPAAAYAAALAAVPHMNIHRLAALVRSNRPEQAWRVVRGEAPSSGLIAKVLADREVAAMWRSWATDERPAEMWERCMNLGIGVTAIGEPDYPACLEHDRQPPAVLFFRGDLQLLAGRRVAIVGTRNATASGRESARQIASGLADAGVHVVSGLARGIDGCAHGALTNHPGPGRPIAVVASGPDIVYPREHAALWQAVASEGLLVTEAPPGTSPEAHRFPLRNRIIAALAEVLVVVESRSKGGSLITVTEAMERGVQLMAVPGAPHNRAAAGTNNLLREGAAVVVDAQDVLDALSIDHHRSSAAVGEQRSRPRRDDREVYDLCAERPRTIDGLVAGSGRPLVDVAMAVARLEHAGWVAQADGWFQAVGSPLR